MENQHNLNRYNPEFKKPIQVSVEWGKDSKGEKDFTISCEKCNVIAGSSGWGIYGNIDKRLVMALKWYKGLLEDDGYTNIEIIHTEAKNG